MRGSSTSLRGLRRAMGSVGVLALAMSLAACRRAPPRPDPAPPVVIHESRDAEAFAPLTEATWLEELHAPADDDAGLGAGVVGVVSVPLGATEPRPVVVALHGAHDRPEWSCGAFRGVSDAYPFIVCPRGTELSDGKLAWSTVPQVERAVERSLTALRARFGVYVAKGPMTLVGFSQGAMLASYVAARDGARFPQVGLIEGAWSESASAVLADDFKSTGGRRILLGCTTPGCLARFAPGEKNFRRTGVEVRLVDAGTRGHNLDDQVVKRLHTAWPWLASDGT